VRRDADHVDRDHTPESMNVGQIGGFSASRTCNECEPQHLGIIQASPHLSPEDIEAVGFEPLLNAIEKHAEKRGTWIRSSQHLRT